MLYRKDDEKFGLFLSPLYALGARLAPSIRRFYAFAVGDLEGSKASSILDVGCGPGDVAIKAASSLRAEFYAVDPSAAMIWIARHRSSSGRVRFDLGSSRRVPFKRKFGIIYASLSFHHWPDKGESLSYLKGFLADKGEIRIYEFKKRRGVSKAVNAHTMDMDSLKEAAGIAGLKLSSKRETKEFIRVTLKK